ncbi:MAG: hypothetical protein K6A36_01035 [Paludibacteraceae bacterium]|nr:hypothetical protein [Paludibacteraceae bacterium]
MYYLCTVFQFIRKYAPLVLFILMSLSAVAIVIDEYNDYCRFSQDMRIESCVELEAEDYEWDEFDDGEICRPFIPQFAPINYQLLMVSRPFSTAFISDKQRLGLVRRYAPRKALLRGKLCSNITITV